VNQGSGGSLLLQSRDWGRIFTISGNDGDSFIFVPQVPVFNSHRLKSVNGTGVFASDRPPSLWILQASLVSVGEKRKGQEVSRLTIILLGPQRVVSDGCAFITSAWQGFKRDVSAHVVIPVKVKIVYRPKGPELPVYCTQVWPYTLSTRAIMCGEPLGRGVTGAVG
jgi:hypothetical protein